MGGAPLLFGPAEPCSPGPPVVVRAQSTPIDTTYASDIITDCFPLCQPLFSPSRREFSTEQSVRASLRRPGSRRNASCRQPSVLRPVPCRQPEQPTGLCASHFWLPLSHSAEIDRNRPVCAFFPGAVPCPTGVLERLTGFQALFHRLLWIFSLSERRFCDIMVFSYARGILRPFARCGRQSLLRPIPQRLPMPSPERKEVLK